MPILTALVCLVALVLVQCVLVCEGIVVGFLGAFGFCLNLKNKGIKDPFTVSSAGLSSD